MDHEYWNQRWCTNDIGFNQSEPNKLMQRYIDSFHLKPGARLFVPLCGKSVDLLWLSQAGYFSVGVELSKLACEAFFKENHLAAEVTHQSDFTVFEINDKKIKLFCGDFFQLDRTLLGPIDMVYDRAALVALPSTLRQRYIEHLLNMLNPGTPIFLITSAYAQNIMNGPPFSIDEEEVKFLYEQYFFIHQLYNKPIENIPLHLQAKGLIKANEQVYHLIFK